MAQFLRLGSVCLFDAIVYGMTLKHTGERYSFCFPQGLSIRNLFLSSSFKQTVWFVQANAKLSNEIPCMFLWNEQFQDISRNDKVIYFLSSADDKSYHIDYYPTKHKRFDLWKEKKHIYIDEVKAKPLGQNLIHVKTRVKKRFSSISILWVSPFFFL